MTRREKIIQLLNDKHTIKQLAENFGVEISEIIEDLEHVKRSIQPRKLRNIPPICKD